MRDPSKTKLAEVGEDVTIKTREIRKGFIYEQSFKKDRLTLHQKGMNVTGTMQRKKVTLAQPYLRRNTH